MSHYIVIPIFSDSSIHPLHKDNRLSLLYVKKLGEKSEMLTFNHLDQLQADSFDFLGDDVILTPNKKFLLYAHPFKNVYDISLLNYYAQNIPLNTLDLRSEALNILYDSYYGFSNTNEIIPIYKHLEYCDAISDEIERIWEKRHDVNFESYEKYNEEAILSFYSIDKRGIKVSGVWDKKLRKHVSNGTLYSDCSLHTSTGRPSNNFGGVNFVALDSDKKKYVVPKNDMLIEFDYDAFHVRLIANLIDYEFPEGSAHDHLAKLYCVDREEGKKMTFQYLYGGVPWEVVQLNPFFDSVNNLIEILWEEFNDTGKIETPIYKRPIFKRNHVDITKTKLFNYYIQAAETEQNIKTIIKLQRYLYKRKTQLILYIYDAFLIDFSNEDGIDILKKIKKILESDNHLTKSKVGFDYGSMKDASHKL